MAAPTPLDLTALLAEVTETTTVDDSVLALIDKFVATIEAANGNQAVIDSAVAGFKAKREQLAAAVTENTDAA